MTQVREVHVMDEKVVYLGHRISKEGIQSTEAKVHVTTNQHFRALSIPFN